MEQLWNSFDFKIKAFEISTHMRRVLLPPSALNPVKHSLGYLYFLSVYFANFTIFVSYDLGLWRIRVCWTGCRFCVCNLCIT